MQCGRYSFCGIHAAALLKHTVIGWCLHRADYVVADTHQAKTLLWRELADGIALDGVVSEIEFCDHIVLVLVVFFNQKTVARP